MGNGEWGIGQLNTLYYSVVARNYRQHKKITHEYQRLVNGDKRWIHPVQRLVNGDKRWIHPVQRLVNGDKRWIHPVQRL
ncbi:MAG: hypothetical protein V7K94_27105, partial [Nostoc sp.]|uniref:hypothetical protein n=1 Tax=Nostoc sp. TaxID=1180 RepID=UPI002FFBFC69